MGEGMRRKKLVDDRRAGEVGGSGGRRLGPVRERLFGGRLRAVDRVSLTLDLEMNGHNGHSVEFGL